MVRFYPQWLAVGEWVHTEFVQLTCGAQHQHLERRWLVFGGNSATKEIIPAWDMYALEVGAPSGTALSQAARPYDMADTILNMRMLDALFDSEKPEGWVQIASHL